MRAHGLLCEEHICRSQWHEAGVRTLPCSDSVVQETGSIGSAEIFHVPVLAQVLADGVDVRELDARWYRSQLGVVSQVCS